jgi:hypothetical protein
LEFDEIINKKSASLEFTQMWPIWNNAFENEELPYDTSNILISLEKIVQDYIQQMKANILERFPDKTLINKFIIFDVRLIPSEETSRLTYGNENVVELFKYYGDIIPNTTKDSALLQWFKARERLYSTEFSGISSTKAVCETIIKSKRFVDIPFMELLCRIAMTISMSSCQCERGFSQLKLIKTPIKSSMKNDLVSAYLSVQFNSPLISDSEISKIGESFWNLKPRRIRISQAHANFFEDDCSSEENDESNSSDENLSEDNDEYNVLEENEESSNLKKFKYDL